jgi:hypothetical protein
MRCLALAGTRRAPELEKTMTHRPSPSRATTRRALRGLALAALTLGTILLLAPSPSHARTPFLAPIHAAPPAGLSVEAKNAAFDKGFDFKFRSDTNATATISIDPLGFSHSDSASLSSSGGSISLSAKYDRSKREIEIKARRGGQDIGEFTWRVEATLR